MLPTFAQRSARTVINQQVQILERPFEMNSVPFSETQKKLVVCLFLEIGAPVWMARLSQCTTLIAPVFSCDSFKVLLLLVIPSHTSFLSWFRGVITHLLMECRSNALMCICNYPAEKQEIYTQRVMLVISINSYNNIRQYNTMYTNLHVVAAIESISVF